MKKGNISIHRKNHLKITINPDDAQDILDKLNNLNDVLLDILIQVVEKRKRPDRRSYTNFARRISLSKKYSQR